MSLRPGQLTEAAACSLQYETWVNDRSWAKPCPGAYQDGRRCVVAVIAVIAVIGVIACIAVIAVIACIACIAVIACIACTVVQCVR
jgi:hypothetical protein